MTCRVPSLAASLWRKAARPASGDSIAARSGFHWCRGTASRCQQCRASRRLACQHRRLGRHGDRGNDIIIGTAKPREATPTAVGAYCNNHGVRPTALMRTSGRVMELCYRRGRCQRGVNGWHEFGAGLLRARLSHPTTQPFPGVRNHLPGSAIISRSARIYVRPRLPGNAQYGISRLIGSDDWTITRHSQALVSLHQFAI